MSELDIGYIARLARIALTDEETQRFGAELGEVLQYVDQLRSIDVSDLEMPAHATTLFNVFRSDEPRDWFTAEEALRNAPRTANDLFIVTKVVE